MSIINEALKKTETQLKHHETKNTPEPPKINMPKPALIYILILLLGFFVGKYIFQFLGAKTPKQPAPKTLSAPLPAPAKISAPAPTETAQTKPATREETKPEQPEFVLNGIFVSGPDAYAIVNNQIVRENEIVDGAKINKITAKFVELDFEGKIIGLSTGR